MSDDRKSKLVEQLFAYGKCTRTLLLNLAESEVNKYKCANIFARAFDSFRWDISGKLKRGDITSSLIDDIDFYWAIVRPMPQFVRTTIRRLDELGHQKEADMLFDQEYKRVIRGNDLKQKGTIAWLCVLTRRHCDDALQTVETLLVDSPLQVDFLCTKAELHFQKGQKEKAFEVIEKCVQLEPHLNIYSEVREWIKKGDPAAKVPGDWP
jgi:hypothetical protein